MDSSPPNLRTPFTRDGFSRAPLDRCCLKSRLRSRKKEEVTEVPNAQRLRREVRMGGRKLLGRDKIGKHKHGRAPLAGVPPRFFYAFPSEEVVS